MSNQTVIMATGETEINTILAQELASHIETVANGLFKEDLIKKIDTFKPHLVIIGDQLAYTEDGERESFLKDLRRRFPGSRIVYIYDPKINDVEEFLKFLVQNQIYDFLSSDDLDLEDLIKLIYQPREYVAVKKYEDKVDLQKIQQKENENKSIKAEQQVISQKQRTIAFYHPSSTGKSTVVQNVAVYLAKADPKLDIALVDADFLQPKLATRLKINSGKAKNKMSFEELLQSIDGNRLNGEMLQEYMTPHPRYPSLKIFNCEFQNPEYQNLLDSHHVERIFEVLKEEFTVILVDMNRDIELIGSDVVLKRATQIYHVLDYDFSNCMDFQRMRYMLAQVPFIQKKPKRIIVNKAFDSTKFKPPMIQSFFQTKSGDEIAINDHLDPVPITAVPFLYQEQVEAIYEGISLVETSGEYSDDFRAAIHEIAETIHAIPAHIQKESFVKKVLRPINSIAEKVIKREAK